MNSKTELEPNYSRDKCYGKIVRHSANTFSEIRRQISFLVKAKVVSKIRLSLLIKKTERFFIRLEEVSCSKSENRLSYGLGYGPLLMTLTRLSKWPKFERLFEL